MPKEAEKKTAKVVVKIDAGLKRLYAQAMKRYQDATRKGRMAWRERYEALAALVEHDPPMFIAGGYSTEEEFFKTEVEEARQTVYRNMRVA